MPWGWGRTGRRTFIAAAAGAVGVALVGCQSNGDGTSAIPAADAAALRQVAGEALDLANRYDAAISQSPDQAAKLTPIRDAHREHADAIGRSLDASVAPAPAPSASASGGGGASGLLKALQAAERAAAERATSACLAVASHHAPLVGAIAAARASHAEALA